jgi:hypothetical protein
MGAMALKRNRRTRSENQNASGRWSADSIGHCFDLLDTSNTKLLAEAFEEFKRLNQDQGLILPKNEQSHKNDMDFTKRLLDCAVINFAVEAFERRRGSPIHSVRCMFSEGQPAFDGSFIRAKSHLQIAVRDRSAILGYFKPSIDFADVQ